MLGGYDIDKREVSYSSAVEIHICGRNSICKVCKSPCVPYEVVGTVNATLLEVQLETCMTMKIVCYASTSTHIPFQ